MRGSVRTDVVHLNRRTRRLHKNAVCDHARRTRRGVCVSQTRRARVARLLLPLCPFVPPLSPPTIHNTYMHTYIHTYIIHTFIQTYTYTYIINTYIHVHKYLHTYVNVACASCLWLCSGSCCVSKGCCNYWSEGIQNMTTRISVYAK